MATPRWPDNDYPADRTGAWRYRTLVLHRATMPGRGSVDAVAVSADGLRVVSGGDDGMLRVWDLDTGTLLHTLTGHVGSVDAVAVSADGRHAASGGKDGTVRVWDLEQGVEVASFASDSTIVCLGATPSSTRVLAGTSTGPVHILELRGYE